MGLDSRFGKPKTCQSPIACGQFGPETDHDRPSDPSGRNRNEACCQPRHKPQNQTRVGQLEQTAGRIRRNYHKGTSPGELLICVCSLGRNQTRGMRCINPIYNLTEALAAMPCGRSSYSLRPKDLLVYGLQSFSAQASQNQNLALQWSTRNDVNKYHKGGYPHRTHFWLGLSLTNLHIPRF